MKKFGPYALVIFGDSSLGTSEERAKAWATLEVPPTRVIIDCADCKPKMVNPHIEGFWMVVFETWPALEKWIADEAVAKFLSTCISFPHPLNFFPADSDGVFKVSGAGGDPITVSVNVVLGRGSKG